MSHCHISGCVDYWGKLGSGVPQLPRRCGHVRDRALHDTSDGQGRGGDSLPHPVPRRSPLHVDQTQQPLSYPSAAGRF